jgi:hypothetical protein
LRWITRVEPNHDGSRITQELEYRVNFRTFMGVESGARGVG